MKRYSFFALGGLLIVGSVLVYEGRGQPAGGPADGFSIHVTAPHIMGDHLIDPMHHFCKLISQDPVLIQCLMFSADAGDDPNARLLGIEYIADKALTRAKVNLGVWNRDWHDHVPEIEAGVLKLPELSGEAAQKIVDVVSGTDGIVFITWPETEPLPSEAKAGIAQAVSHEIVTPDEYVEPLSAANRR
jgi:hypothetical protein